MFIMKETDKKFMQMAIELSKENIEKGGGPFGAVIVKAGKVIATGANRVVPNNDPTAHAEVSAIREACKKIGTFKLEGCTIYTSCEPCPMCLSAIYWAGISKIYYGNTKDDAKKISFDDSFIYDEIAKPYACRAIPICQIMRTEAIEAFKIWEEKEDKTRY
jgi:guanine deaminase